MHVCPVAAAPATDTDGWLFRYAVSNTQPRPESYREDYITANNESYYAASGIIYPPTHALNESERATLYANLATGAESGWDYTSRWIANPRDAVDDVYFPLRSLNTANIVGVDLNSILYANEQTIAGYLEAAGNRTGAADYAARAERRAAAMYALMWNADEFAYFDYNLTSAAQNVYVPAADAADGRRQVFFHAAQLFPFWLGAAPAHLKENPLAVRRAYRRVDALLTEKAGAVAATDLETGQQWDEPNVWPPLMHALMEGLLRTPPTFGADDPDYAATQSLALRLGQRYLDSTFCSWRATGGATSETPRLEGLGPQDVGVMFEKYGDNATNAVGSGGEYEVVEGFGWTNGVLIWTVDTFGARLRRPDCGNITAAHTHAAPAKARRAVELHPFDAQWTKKFGRRSVPDS